MKPEIWESAMNIELPSELQSYVEGLVESGRYATTNEAVLEAIRLLAARERLKEQIELGQRQAAVGDVHDHDTVFGQLRAMAAEAASGQ